MWRYNYIYFRSNFSFAIKFNMNNNYLNNKKIKILILILLCLASFIWSIISIVQLRKSGKLETNYSFKNHYFYSRNTSTNVNSIMTWMTFDYINVIFKLNPAYLKNALAIDDIRYPNIRIDRYAKHHNLNDQVFLSDIKQIITNYINSKK